MNSSSRLGNNGRMHPAIAGAPVIRVEARYRAPSQRVFDAWLDPDVAGRWLFATSTRPIAHVEIDARAAGSFRFVERRGDGPVEHRGEYVEIVPHRRLVFSLVLVDRPRVRTRVSVELEPRETGCKLSLTHENVPFDLVSITEARWTGILYGLGVTLEAFAGDSKSERRAIAHDIVLPRLMPLQASARREAQPTRNERSE